MSSKESLETMDRIYFRLISFFIEDIFKYKQGFLTAKEIFKTKASDDRKDQKKEKKLKKGR